MSGNMSAEFHDRCVEELVPIFREELGTNTEFTLDYNQMTDLAMTAYARAIIAFKLDKAPKIHFSDFVYPAKAVILKEMEAAKIKTEAAAKTSDLDEKYVLVDGPLTANGNSIKTAGPANPAKVRKMRKAPVSVCSADNERMSDEMYDALVEILLERRKDLGRFKKDETLAMTICTERMNMFLTGLIKKIEPHVKAYWVFYYNCVLQQAFEEFDANQESFVAKKSDFEFSFVDDAFTDVFCEQMVNILFAARIDGSSSAMKAAERSVQESIERVSADMESYSVDIYAQKVVETARGEAFELAYVLGLAANALLQTVVNGKNGVSHAIAEAPKPIEADRPKSAAELHQELVSARYAPDTFEESKVLDAFNITRDSAEVPKKSEPKTASTSYLQIVKDVLKDNGSALKYISQGPEPIIEPKKSAIFTKSEPKQESKLEPITYISTNPVQLPFHKLNAVRASKTNGRPRKPAPFPVDAEKAAERKFKPATSQVMVIPSWAKVEFIPALYVYDPITFNQVLPAMEFYTPIDSTHKVNLFSNEVLRNMLNGISLQQEKQGLKKVTVMRIDVQPGTIFEVKVLSEDRRSVKEVTLMLGDLCHAWNMQVTRFNNVPNNSAGRGIPAKFIEQLRDMFVVCDGKDERYIELQMYAV